MRRRQRNVQDLEVQMEQGNKIQVDKQNEKKLKKDLCGRMVVLEIERTIGRFKNK